MAKLKLWVRNLIIVLVLVVSLAGLGVGIYFMLKPDQPEGPGSGGRELSQQQKEFISAVENTKQPDIDISSYDGMALEDGTSIDATRIVSVCGNYLVITHPTTGQPEFYSFVKAEPMPAQTASTSANNVLLKKIAINSAYTHVLKMFGDYAIVANDSEGTDQRIVSLKTGDTALTEQDYNYEYLLPEIAEEVPGIGSYIIGVQASLDNFLLVAKQTLLDYNVETQTPTLQMESYLVPLDNPAAKMTFNETLGQLVTYKITDDYLIIVTTKHTHIFSTTLSADGELVAVMPTLNNNFETASGDEIQVESSLYGGFKNVVYHTVQPMPNGLILTEKNTIENKETVVENNYNVVYAASLLDSENLIEGINYSIYDVTNQQYITNAPNFGGKVEVLDSFADGYYVFRQTGGDAALNYESSLENAYVYNSSFEFVLAYNSLAYGYIIGYNGENFILTGTKSSTILDPWGNDASHHSGYNIVSKTTYDNYVVVKNDKYYSIYNTITGEIFSDNFIFISEIMNGNVLAYKEGTGYYTINLKLGVLASPVYNFDTTLCNGTYSLNLAMGSVGFYFTYTEANKYTYVGFDGTTYKNIDNYSHKIINDKIYLTLNFENGSKKLIVSTIIGTIGNLTAETIAQTYSFNLTPPAAQTTALAVPTALDPVKPGDSSAIVGNINYTTGINGYMLANGAMVTTSSNSLTVPSYTINLKSDLIFYGVDSGWKNDSYNGVSYKRWTDENTSYGINVTYIKAGSKYPYYDGYEYIVNNMETGVYEGLFEWWITQFGGDKNQTDRARDNFPLPKYLQISDEYISMFGRSWDAVTKHTMIGAIAVNTPYGFILVARYGFLYEQHGGGRVFQHHDRVVVGLDKSAYVKTTHFKQKGWASQDYNREFQFVTAVPRPEGYVAQGGTSGDIDWPSLTYRPTDNLYPVADLGWSCDSFYSVINDKKVSALFDSGVSMPHGGFSPREVPYSTHIYSADAVWDLGYGSAYYDDSNNWMETVKATGTIIDLSLTISPFVSEFERFHGARDWSYGGDDQPYSNYKTDDGKWALENSSGLLLINNSGRGSEKPKDSGHSNTLTFKMPGYSSSGNTNAAARAAFSASLEYRRVLGYAFGNPTYKNGWVSAEHDDQYESVNTGYCLEYQLKASKDGKVYPFINKIKNLRVTYTLDSGNNQWRDYALVGGIYTAGAADTSSEDTDEYLFLARGLHGNIEYGFWSTNKYRGIIGAKRKDLSAFTENCTFGYVLTGLQFGGTKYFDDDGEYLYGKSCLDILATGNILSTSAYQEPLLVNLNLKYIKETYDGVVTDELINSTDVWEDPIEIGTVKYNDTLTGLISLDTYDPDDAEYGCLRGYTHTGWEAVARQYIKFDSSQTNRWSVQTENTQVTNGQSLRYYHIFATGFHDSYNLTKTADAKEIANGTPLTLTLYAKYAPKEYNFQIDLNSEGSGTAKLFVWDNEEGCFTDNNSLLWQSKEIAAYGTNLTLPIMYVEDNGKFYSVELCDSGNTSKQTLSQSGATYQISVANSSLTEVLISGTDFHINDTTNEENNVVQFNAHLNAMGYDTKYAGTQDSHVYGNEDLGDEDLVNEKLLEVSPVEITGTNGYGEFGIDDWVYGTTMGEAVGTFVNPYGQSSTNLIFGLSSGNSYTFKFNGFTNAYKLKFVYTFEMPVATCTNVAGECNIFSHCGCNGAKETYTFNVYYNYDSTNSVSGTTYDIYCNPSSKTWAETNPFGLEFTFNDSRTNCLTLTVGPLAGGRMVCNGTSAVLKGEISVSAEITTQEYIVNVSSKDSAGGSSDLTTVPNVSISEQNQYCQSELNKNHIYGHGSTLIINGGTSMYKKLHKSVYVPNQFMSGATIKFGTTEKFKWNVSNLSDSGYDAYVALFTDFTRNYASASKLYDRGTYSDSINYGSVTVVWKEQLPALLQLMYSTEQEKFNTNNLTSEDTVYCTVYPMVSGKQTVYLLVTYIDGTNAQGMASAFVYSLADMPSYNGTNTYNIDIEYTKYNSTLIWNAEAVGPATSTDLGVGDKYYLTAYNHEGKPIYKTEGEDKYINLFDKKVYVTIGAEDKLVVDASNTAADSFNDLFGASGVLKNNYESATGYIFNQQGAAGNVSFGFVFGADNGAQSGSHFYDDYNNATKETTPKPITEEDNFNFAAVAPSNSFSYTLSVNKGYYIKELSILYNGVTYKLEIAELSINNGQIYINPIYKLTKSTDDNYERTEIAGSLQDESYTLLDDILDTFGMFNIWIRNINPAADNTTVMKLEIGFITSDAKISVKYGAYTMLAVDFEDENFTTEQNENKHIAWDYDGSELKIYNDVSYSGEGVGNVVSAIKFNGLTPTIFAAAIIDDTSTDYRPFAASNGTKNYTKTGEQRVYFMALDCLPADAGGTTPPTSTTKPVSVTKYINVKATLADNAFYELKFDDSTNPILAKNTAEWAATHADTAATEQNIINSAGANFIAYFKIFSSSAGISTTITSDIEFGQPSASAIWEETDAAEVTNGVGETVTSTLKTNEASLYYIGETNGQIASKGSQISGKIGGQNFADEATQDYAKYNSVYALKGKKLVYTLQAAYGYQFTGITFSVKIGIESTWYSSAVLPVSVTTETEFDVKNSDGTSKAIVGKYIYEAQENGVYTLTINLTNGSIKAINVDLHYDAKEFDVIYDTDADFGTSPVGLTNAATETVSNQTRTFTYNLKDAVNKGIDAESLTYGRIGYDQMGWAFADFFKTADGKTEVKGAVSSAEDLTTTNYLTQLYAIDQDAGYYWYLSLGETYGNVFGTTNAAGATKVAGQITMSAVWKAKTYNLDFDYNDSNSEANGSTQSTKYAATWVFDMPLNVADIASSNLSFANIDFATENTLLNSISRVYRLGYQFNGWYFVDGTFGETWDSASLVYNATASGDNIFTLWNNSKNTVSGSLGYAEGAVIPEYVFGYDIYKAITSAWAENAGETNSYITLYASWTANTYTFAYDLNGWGESDSLDNHNGALSWENDGSTTSLTVNQDKGIGSTIAHKETSETGATQVIFDSVFNAQILAYAFRDGYKFSGWFASRTPLENNDFGLLEEQTLNAAILVNMINGGDELAAVKAKVNQKFDQTSIVETLASTAATIADDNHWFESQPTTWGNIMLLHARWESLPYTINIDLNNWKHEDYGWEDADYIVAVDTKYKADNKVTNIEVIVYFDKPFNTCTLKIGGTEVGSATQIEYVRNGVKYTTTGTTAYDKLIQIINAYGYLLENGNETYKCNFTLIADGEGTADGYSEDTSINATDESIFDDKMFAAASFFNATKEHDANLDGTTDIKLAETDYSGNANMGDRHDTDIINETAFGTRKFTLFACWTIKKTNTINAGSQEKYNNSLDTENTNQTVFYEEDSSLKHIEDVWVEGGPDASNVNAVYNGHEYYPNYTYYVVPATGQYVNKLRIEFLDNYYNNGFDRALRSNKLHGYIELTFGWNSVTHEVTILSAIYSIGNCNAAGEYVETSNGTLTIAADEKSATLETKLNYLFQNSITINVSKYQNLDSDIAEEENGKNINTYYQNDNYREAAQNWLTEAGYKDVNYLTVNINGAKGNTKFITDTMGQTYQVDYYRYVRPFDQMQTHIEEDTESEKFGSEVWDSNFLNSWDQYTVYKTVTYRYGEYASTSYSYATNFGFGGWYYYQGHIDNYQEYENYGSADHIFQTHTDENGNRYCSNCGHYHAMSATTDHLFDFLGKWGVVDGENFKEGEVITYTWDGSKYVNNNDANDVIEISKVMYEGTYTWDSTRGQYVNPAELNYADVLDIPRQTYTVTYIWNESEGKYVNQADPTDMLDDERIVDASSPTGYQDTIVVTEYQDTIKQQTYKRTLTTRSYKYNTGYEHFKFDNAPVSGNLSIVGIYYPAAVHKVHYYTWKDSSSPTAGYEERNASSNQYVLGEKHVAKVTDVPDPASGGTTSYTYIEYWELGTNDTYYRVGFSGFNATTGDMPTLKSSIEFLMQFVNPDNYEDYELDEALKLTISYNQLQEIIQTSYPTITGSTAPELAINLLRHLLKTDVYKAYEYLDKYDVLSLMGVSDFTPDKSKNDYTNLKNLYTLLINNPATITEKEMGHAIIDRLSADQLSVLLDNIAIDYFGFVLVNPSANIGHWPQGTYLAGWYMVQEDLLEALVGEGSSYKNYVLTYNSNSFIAGADPVNNLQCLPITGTTTDHLGNITYTVELNRTSYTITRFNTANAATGIGDVLSRVDSSVHVFAAYNSYKFNITPKLQIFPQFNATVEVDIQWGTDVFDTDGSPYEYKESDVRYAALTVEQMTLLKQCFDSNSTLPTALQQVIDVGNTLDSVEEAVNKVLNEGLVLYIVAYVYNVDSITIENKPDGKTEKVVNFNEHINTVATNCILIPGSIAYSTPNLLDVLNNIE